MIFNYFYFNLLQTKIVYKTQIQRIPVREIELKSRKALGNKNKTTLKIFNYI
jgi:hypothetical protein